MFNLNTFLKLGSIINNKFDEDNLLVNGTNIYYEFKYFYDSIIYDFWKNEEPSCDKLTYAICYYIQKFYDVNMSWAFFGSFVNDFYHVIPILNINNKKYVLDLTYPSQRISPGIIYEYTPSLVFKNGIETAKFVCENKFDEKTFFDFEYEDITFNTDDFNDIDSYLYYEPSSFLGEYFFDYYDYLNELI